MRRRLTSTLRAQDGASLLELVVAMAIASIIMIAIVGLLEFTTTQASRINERVQADRLGRAAMTRIVEELHSSCTGFGSQAVQAPGTTPAAPLEPIGPTNLWYVSAYGSSTSKSAVEKTVYLHDISWAEEAKKNGQGTLTDYSFESVAGSGPGTTTGNWTFPTLEAAKAQKRVLATKVTPVTISGTKTLFQYYSLSTSTGAFTQVTEKIPAEATASKIAKVAISFSQAPEGGQTKLARAVSFNDAVVLRLNPTETGEGAKDETCT
jgi:Tfp pilus assembly protein PilW